MDPIQNQPIQKTELLFKEQLHAFTREGLLNGYLYVKDNGSLTQTNLLNYLVEKFKALLGYKDSTNPRLLELKTVQFLKSGKEWIKTPDDIELIKILAKRTDAAPSIQTIPSKLQTLINEICNPKSNLPLEQKSQENDDNAGEADVDDQAASTSQEDSAHSQKEQAPANHQEAATSTITSIVDPEPSIPASTPAIDVSSFVIPESKTQTTSPTPDNSPILQFAEKSTPAAAPASFGWTPLSKVAVAAGIVLAGLTATYLARQSFQNGVAPDLPAPTDAPVSKATTQNGHDTLTAQELTSPLLPNKIEWLAPLRPEPKPNIFEQVSIVQLSEKHELPTLNHSSEVLIKPLQFDIKNPPLLQSLTKEPTSAVLRTLVAQPQLIKAADNAIENITGIENNPEAARNTNVENAPTLATTIEIEPEPVALNETISEPSEQAELTDSTVPHSDTQPEQNETSDTIAENLPLIENKTIAAIDPAIETTPTLAPKSEIEPQPAPLIETITEPAEPEPTFVQTDKTPETIGESEPSIIDETANDSEPAISNEPAFENIKEEPVTENLETPSSKATDDLKPENNNADDSSKATQSPLHTQAYSLNDYIKPLFAIGGVIAAIAYALRGRGNNHDDIKEQDDTKIQIGKGQHNESDANKEDELKAQQAMEQQRQDNIRKYTEIQRETALLKTEIEAEDKKLNEELEQLRLQEQQKLIEEQKQAEIEKKEKAAREEKLRVEQQKLIEQKRLEEAEKQAEIEKKEKAEREEKLRIEQQKLIEQKRLEEEAKRQAEFKQQAEIKAKIEAEILRRAKVQAELQQKENAAREQLRIETQKKLEEAEKQKQELIRIQKQNAIEKEEKAARELQIKIDEEIKVAEAQFKLQIEAEKQLLESSKSLNSSLALTMPGADAPQDFQALKYSKKSTQKSKELPISTFTQESQQDSLLQPLPSTTNTTSTTSTAISKQSENTLQQQNIENPTQLTNSIYVNNSFSSSFVMIDGDEEFLKKIEEITNVNNGVAENNPKALSLLDAKALIRLSCIGKNQIINVDANGIPSDPFTIDYYSYGILNKLMRTYNIRSNDYSKLRLLMQRALIAYRHSENADIAKKIGEALIGLDNLRNCHETQDQNTSRVIDEIKEFTLKSLDKIKKNGFNPVSPNHIKLSLFEASLISSTLLKEAPKDVLDGVDYYLERIEDFLFFEEEYLDSEDIKFLKQMQTSLLIAKEHYNHRQTHEMIQERKVSLYNAKHPDNQLTATEDGILKSDADKILYPDSLKSCCAVAIEELQTEFAKQQLADLEKTAPFQKEIGLHLPMNFGWYIAHNRYVSRAGHAFYIRVYKDDMGTYTVAQANAGGLGLGKYTSLLGSNRHTIVEFKNITEGNLVEFLKKTHSLREQFFHYRDEPEDTTYKAKEAYDNLFTLLKSDPVTDGIPARRAQFKSNCSIRSIKESLIHVFQKGNRTDLANHFLTYPISRHLSAHSFDTVLPLEKISNSPSVKNINIKKNDNDNGAEDIDEEDRYTDAEFDNSPLKNSIMGFYERSQIVEDKSASLPESKNGLLERMTKQVINTACTFGNTAFSIAATPVSICNEIKKFIFPPNWVVDKYKIGVENIFSKLADFDNAFARPDKATVSNKDLEKLVETVRNSAKGTDPQTIHTNFLNALRAVINSKHYQDEFKNYCEGRNYDPLVHTVHEICRIRFEEGNFHDFLDGLMTKIGIVGNGKVRAEDFDIIDNLDPEFKISAFEVNLKKFFGHVNMNFDPHMQGNLPFVLGTLQIGDKAVRLLRMGSPTIEGCIGKAEINPEFKGYLQHCMMKNKVHLYISLQNDKAKMAGTGDETGRNGAIKELQKEFPKNFFAVVLAQDSRFYKQVDAKGKALDSQNSQDFIAEFTDELLVKKDTGFYFPPAWKDDPEFVKSISNLLQFVLRTTYEGKMELTRQEKQDFIEIFYANLSLFLMLYSKADNCNASCKDAIDRAGKLNSLILKLAMIIEETIDEEIKQRLHKVLTHSPAFWTKSQAIICSHSSDSSNGRRERLISAEETMHDKRHDLGVDKLPAKDIGSYLSAAAA